MIRVKCGQCRKRVDAYPSDLAHSRHGVLFCSQPCKNAWVSKFNSLRLGGDGKRRTKAQKDALAYRRDFKRRRLLAREYYAKKRSEILAKKREQGRRAKAEIIVAYGGKCECCGEATHEFLTIDHRNGDGAAHRRELGKKAKGRHFYRELKRLGFPRDRFRLLCFNCNIARGFCGYCPHRPDDKSNVSHRPFTPGRKCIVF